MYEAAVPYLERAVAMAERLDNPIHLAAAAASLAIAHGRIGRPQEQVRFADRALAHVASTDWSLIALAATYERAVGLALCAEDAAARASLGGFDLRCRGGCPTWAQQAMHLMKADVLMLIGDERRAYASARKGLSLSAPLPLIQDLAGIYFRWRALVAVRCGEAEGAARELKAIVSGPTTLHVKDRAELLASLGTLERVASMDSSETSVALQRLLSTLPMGVGRVLNRIGLLPSLS
jgi:hypothetical protein